VWAFLGHPRRTRARFPYLPWGQFLEVYAWQPFLQLLALPSLRTRRRRDWITQSPSPLRTDVVGGVSHGS
jgi:hypothetical protein